MAIKDAKDLMYAMAKRAQVLADTPMAALRRVEAGDASYAGSPRDTRGQIIENVLVAEFEDDAKTVTAEWADE